MQTPTPVIIQQRNPQPQFTVNNNLNIQNDRNPTVINPPRNQFVITDSNLPNLNNFNFNPNPTSNLNLNLNPSTSTNFIINNNNNNIDFIRNGQLSRIPTNSQINRIVSQGNGLLVRQLVTALINSNLRSTSVADALQNIIGAMRSIINVYDLSNNVRIQAIDPYQRQLRILRAQLADIRSGVSYQQLNSFRVDQRKLLDATDMLQKQYGTIRTQIEDLQNQILSLRQQTNTISIDDLGRFTTSRISSSSSLSQIDNLNQQIQQNKQRLQQIQKNILDISFIMDNSRDTIRTYNRYGSLAPKQRQLQLVTLIKNLQNTITNVQNQSSNVILAYKDITNQYPNIVRLINNYYYKIFGISNISGEQNILNYLNDVYRPNSRLVSSSSIRNSNNNLRSPGFDFRAIELLNNDWIDRYGMPIYTEDLLSQNYDQYNQNFVCDPLSDQLLTYGGIIQDIDGNVLRVSAGRDQNYYIELGGCSRLESLTKRNLPQIGDFVFCRGKYVNNKKLGRIYRTTHAIFY